MKLALLCLLGRHAWEYLELQNDATQYRYCPKCSRIEYKYEDMWVELLASVIVQWQPKPTRKLVLTQEQAPGSDWVFSRVKL